MTGHVGMQVVVGVHIGVRRTTVVVGDATGQEAVRAQTVTLQGEADEMMSTIAELVQSTLAAADTPAGSLTAVGVSVPGLVEVRGGKCLLAPNLGWKDVPVKASLEALLDVPVFVHNTAQACAVAESFERQDEGRSELVFLYAGSGIGAGIITEGHLYHGTFGVAGEIGHCPMLGATDTCTCGNIGCLETVAAGRAVATAARRSLGAGAPSSLASLERSKVDAQAVVDAANAGDALGIRVIAKAGADLGIATAWLVNLFSPQLVVVGGILSEAGDLLLGPLRDVVHRMALPQAGDAVVIERSRLGQSAEVRGALLLALQSTESSYRVVFDG